MVGDGLGSDVGINPELVYLYTKAAKKGTTLPVLAKMTPNITSMLPPALRAVEAGADGLAAINTIKSIMNIDLDNFSSEPNVCGRSSVGGHQAIKMNARREPVLDGKKCVGCHLCKVVCPVNAVTSGKKVSKLSLSNH